MRSAFIGTLPWLLAPVFTLLRFAHGSAPSSDIDAFALAFMVVLTFPFTGLPALVGAALVVAWRRPRWRESRSLGAKVSMLAAVVAIGALTVTAVNLYAATHLWLVIMLGALAAASFVPGVVFSTGRWSTPIGLSIGAGAALAFVFATAPVFTSNLGPPVAAVVLFLCVAAIWAGWAAERVLVWAVRSYVAHGGAVVPRPNK